MECGPDGQTRLYKCARHPQTPVECLAYVGSRLEPCCWACHRDHTFVHETVDIRVAAEEVITRLKGKCDEIEELKRGTSRVVKSLKGKVVRVRQDSVRVRGLVESQIDRLCQGLINRKESMIKNVLESADRRKQQLNCVITQIRQWDNTSADEILLETEALNNLCRSKDHLVAARCLCQMVTATEYRLQEVARIENVLPLSKSADGVLLYTGADLHTDQDLTLDTVPIHGLIEQLDLKTPREQQQRPSSCTVAGKITPKDRLTLKQAAETLEQITRERDEALDQLELMKTQLEQTKAELARVECGIRTAASPVAPVADASTKIRRLERALSIAHAELRDSRATHKMHEELSTENQRLRTIISNSRELTRQANDDKCELQEQIDAVMADANNKYEEVIDENRCLSDLLAERTKEAKHAEQQWHLQRGYRQRAVMELSQEWQQRQQAQVEQAQATAKRAESEAREAVAKASRMITSHSEQSEMIVLLREELEKSQEQTKQARGKLAKLMDKYLEAVR